jgi:hypothetical protein
MISLSKTLRKDNINRRVAGLQKLAQRYALILLTPKGTLAQPNR